MIRSLIAQAGRAAALLTTVVALSATSYYQRPPIAFDAATSCGPAGALTLTHEPEFGCRGDETLRVVGGPEAGLPQWADFTPEDVLVLAGDVSLPGSEPPLVVRRVCRAELPVDGVRAISCEGDAPEAACSGTLTERPAEEPAP